jgi:hypothetical protein
MAPRTVGAWVTGVLACGLVVSGCQSSSYGGLEQEDARRVALQALREEAGGTRLVKNLTVVDTVKGRSRRGNAAWLIAFSRPRSSEIGCVWIWRPDHYRYEIDRCPTPLAGGRPPSRKPPLTRATFGRAFAVCSAASREELAAAYGLPAGAPRKIVARAVASPAVGLLDPRGEAYRGCLAGMNNRQRLATEPTALAKKP